jgi:parvulin-like peptidyl-prolyl isomerase
MKWIFLVCFLFLTSFSFAQKDAAVVATVGSKKITLGEFNKKYNAVVEQVLSNPPSKKVFLEDLVRYEIGLQEAKKRGLDRDPIVQDQMNQAMYKGLLEKELGEKVQNSKVSDAEMKAWYSKNPQIRVSTILIEVKPGATEAQRAEAKKRAEQILKEVRSSKRPFEELVRLYSDDTTTKNLGGDVGWQSRITLNSAYYNAANGLKTNEITTELVEVPFGFHIIKLTGRRAFEEAPKREIRMAVFDEKRAVLFNQFFDRLKKNYPVNVNSNLVE